MSTDAMAKNANEIIAPVAGWISVLNVNTTAATQNLALCGPQATGTNANTFDANFIPQGTVPFGCVNRYVTFEAIGCNVGVAFSNSNAGAANINTANTGVNGVGCCIQILNGTTKDIFIHSYTQWMGYQASSGSGTLVIYPSSRGL